MKSIKSIGIILLIFLQSNLFLAQDSYEIEGVYSITSEKLVSNNAKDIFDSKLFHSFGLNGKRIFKSNFFIKGGLHLNRFGTKFDVEVTTVQMPEGTGEFYAVKWNASGIDVPVSLGFYFLNRNKLRLGVAIGVSNLFVISQTQTTQDVKSDIEIYKDYIFSLNSNLEIGIKVSNNMILNIIPVWKRQMNSNFSEYKQRRFGCQIGMSYSFRE